MVAAMNSDAIFAPIFPAAGR